MIPGEYAGIKMKRFVEGTDRGQITVFPAVLDDYVGEDNPVRAIDAFLDGLDLAKLGFDGVAPLATGRPAYHPAPLLKIYIYGYFNRVQSSRRLERECQRNVELVWLTGHLMPDFKTIADFRKDNGKAIREVCRTFVALCCKLDLLSEPSVAIDGSKFKAVNNRDKNFTEAKMKRRLEQIDESIARYLSQLDTADRQGPTVPEAKTTRLKEKIAKLREEIERLKMRVRRQTVEHPCGTIKAWMGATHFQMRRLTKVASEMALHVLAYNMKRVMQILGVCGLMAAMRA